MGQVLTQGVNADLSVLLTSLAGVPATGVLFSQVSCQFLREGDTSLNNFVLTSSNFNEAGNGFYRITFDGAVTLNTVGMFLYRVFGAGLQTFANEAQIRSPASLIPSTPAALPLCTVTGNINDLTGVPIPSVAISARVLGLPTIENAIGLTDDVVSATTDDNGVFFLQLVRGAVVEVTIPRINYRRQLTVPNQASADLFSGIV